MEGDPIDQVPAAESAPAETAPAAVDPVEASATPEQPAEGTPPVQQEAGEYDDLLEKVEDDPADPSVPPAEAGAFDVKTLPQPLQEALAISEYVKSPETVKQAVEAANEVWDVQTGKKDAGMMIDAVRQYNPERYASMMGELERYLGWASEKGLYKSASPNSNTPAEDPALAEIRGQLREMQTRDQTQQREREQAQMQAENVRTRETFTNKLAELSKGTFIEGDPSIQDAVLAQLDKNNVGAQKFAADLKKGDTTSLERAIKQVKNDRIKMVQQYNKNLKDHAQRLRSTTPGAPGQGGKPITAKGGTPNRADYPDGEAGRMKWQEDYAVATGLLKQ